MMKYFLLMSFLVLGGCSLIDSTQSTQVPIIREVLPNVVVKSDFKVGAPAPIFITRTLSGKPFDSSEYYGKTPIVVDFWSSWCHACVTDMMELERLSKQYAKEIVVIGVHRTDTELANEGIAFADERDVTYPLIQDDGSLYLGVTQGIAMPATIFIDQEGVVQDIWFGPKPGKIIQEKIESLLAYPSGSVDL